MAVKGGFTHKAHTEGMMDEDFVLNFTSLCISSQHPKTINCLQYSLLTALYFPVFGIKLFPSTGLHRLFVAIGVRDSFHKTFMCSAFVFASTGVSVWVLALTKEPLLILAFIFNSAFLFFSLTVANILWREEGTSRLHYSIH